MKQCIVLTCAIVCLLLTACHDKAVPIELSQIGVTDAAVVQMSQEDAAVVFELLQKTRWVQGTADCLDDCLITLPEGSIRYHSSCGTFNDPKEDRSCMLSDLQQQELNEILRQYIPLEEYYS